MKTVTLLLTLTISVFSFAQTTYTVNNETLELKTEVEGTYDLLWNTFDGKYRYFIKNEDEQLTELTNTKGSDNKYNNAYQDTLKAILETDASKVKLTLPSLKNFINQSNAASDPNYTFDTSTPKLKTRVGVFGGITNNPFVTNPDNKSVPFFGAELELFQDTPITKHAGFLNIRTAGDTADFNYSSTQIALGYRFRFINTSKFNIYGQTKFATFTASKTTYNIEDIDNLGTFKTEDKASTSFDIPLAFGVGADFKVGNGYITFVYDNVFAILQDTSHNFPMDIALGYKFSL
ncbi:hypothetical protein [Olleya sp. Bg11-27]|uniref:hypothetical protein n=1 Tax=Olleya sp. Bg11-27 TaxID=2058135 RepID=UPI000C315E76|nr:hypothetical protein [Olleya sp. Bg11-27]AUC74376.1 hypothetical protein CW732_01250 [Olleya sp. Bg11-27]